MKAFVIPVIVSIMIFGTLNQAFAVPSGGNFQDHAQCDPIGAIGGVLGDEIGIAPPFPSDEELSVILDPEQNIGSCPPTNGSLDDQIIRITNLSGHNWVDVWYVVDHIDETSITNWDGFINSKPGFKVDSVGINQPLKAESISADNIWQNGETWTVVLQDYQSILPASALGSIGIGDGSVGDAVSSGSILVANEVQFAVGGTIIPIDTTSLLLAGASVNVWMIPVVLSAAGFGILIARKI